MVMAFILDLLDFKPNLGSRLQGKHGDKGKEAGGVLWICLWHKPGMVSSFGTGEWAAGSGAFSLTCGTRVAADRALTQP
jgi:hypothetical protein